MGEWVSERTFEQLGLPRRIHVYRAALDPKETVAPLDPEKHAELYQYFNSGGQILHMTNAEGRVELFLLFPEVEAGGIRSLFEAKLGLHADDTSDNRFIASLVVYDKADDPLELPFIFVLTDDQHRYEATAFCEQAEIDVYFLTQYEGMLVQLFAKALEWPPEVRQSLRTTLLKAYGADTSPGSSQFAASDLANEEITADGLSYQYESGKLEEMWGRGTPHQMEKGLRAALATLAGSKNEGLRHGPFVVWAAVKPEILNRSNGAVEGMVYFVSPYYHERMSGRRSDSDPCYRTLSELPGFIRSEGGSPVWEGAVPVLRYEDGEVQKVVVDKAFLERAAALHDDISRRYRMIAGMPGVVASPALPNRYRGLLEHLSKNRRS